MVIFRAAFFVVFLFMVGTVPVYAGSCFSQLIAFGDSNIDSGAADEGSVYNLTEGMVNGPPNVGGRSGNGPVAVEYAADELGIPLVNYSVAGAMTDLRNIIADVWPDVLAAYPQVEFTGALSQINEFEESLYGELADPRALYVYWAGSNDLVGATPEDLASRVAAALDNIEEALTRLTELGARKILVATRTTRPDFTGQNNINGVILNAAIRVRIFDLNQRLSSKRANIQIFEAFDLITDMMYNPALYGFTETTALCIDDPLCSTDLSVAAGYVQWDGAHKTTRVQEILAEKLVIQAKNMRRGRGHKAKE